MVSDYSLYEVREQIIRQNAKIDELYEELERMQEEQEDSPDDYVIGYEHDPESGKWYEVRLKKGESSSQDFGIANI